VADDLSGYLRSLKRRGYGTARLGSGHIEIARQGAVVATAQSARAFEQDRVQPRAVRKPKQERGKRL
jgi:hypothetical protein